MPKPLIKVQCQECGRKFQTSKDIPECPKCGGVDIDVRTDDARPAESTPLSRLRAELAEGDRQESRRAQLAELGEKVLEIILAEIPHKGFRPDLLGLVRVWDGIDSVARSLGLLDGEAKP